eukprot:3993210-Prymnesium_polylepis.1
MNRHIADSVVESLEGGREPGRGDSYEHACGRVAPPANLAKPPPPDKPSSSPTPTLADRELKIFNDVGFSIKLHAPDHFLGCNITPGETPSTTH